MFNLLWLSGLLVGIIPWTLGVSSPGDFANARTLVQVQVLFRHGERYPLGPILNDKHDMALPPETWGQLTEGGKREMFELGKYLRNRYSKLVGKQYNRKEVYGVSSDSDRTIQSGLLTLMGFFKEYVDAATWDPSYPKAVEALPLRTIPKDFDRMIKMEEKCPNKEANFKRPLNTLPYWLSYLKKKEIRDIVEISGYKTVLDTTRSNFDRIFDFGYIQDNISIKKLTNQTLPAWAEEAMRNPDFSAFKGHFYGNEMKSYKQRLMTGGPLLQYMLNNMDKKIVGHKDGKKMIFLSGHDFTIVYLLGTLHAFEINVEHGVPFFGSALMMELHTAEASQNEFIVQLWLRNETNRAPYLLKIPGCDEPCNFASFKDITKDYIPEDWNKLCTENAADDTESSGYKLQSWNVILYMLLGYGAIAHFV